MNVRFTLFISGLLLPAAWLFSSFNASGNDAPVAFLLEFNRFQTPEGQPYAECYVSVDGSGLVLKPAPGGYQSAATIFFQLSRIAGQDTTIIAMDTTRLNSVLITDTLGASRRAPLMDLRRFPLEPGSYEVVAMVSDANRSKQPRLMAVRNFEIATPVADRVTFSDVELLDQLRKTTTKSDYSKNGLELVPLVSNYTLSDRDTLIFYTELYHTNTIQAPGGFFIQANLRQHDRVLPDYSLTIGRKPLPYDAFSGRINIRKLPEGEYSLEISLMSFQNQLLSRTQTFFTVRNSRLDESAQYTSAGEKAGFLNALSTQELDQYLKTLRYASTERELGMTANLETENQKRNYIYGFWEKRLAAGQTVEYKFHMHQDAIDYANKNFKSAMRPGWETERGRVLIKYGTPNNVERYPAESGFVPYEIWRYDRVQAQNSVVFIFADLDVATNEYPLLHSNKFGESANPLWRQDLRRNSVMNPGNDYEDSGNQNGFDTKLNPLD